MLVMACRWLNWFVFVEGQTCTDVRCLTFKRYILSSHPLTIRYTVSPFDYLGLMFSSDAQPREVFFTHALSLNGNFSLPEHMERGTSSPALSILLEKRLHNTRDIGLRPSSHTPENTTPNNPLTTSCLVKSIQVPLAF